VGYNLNMTKVVLIDSHAILHRAYHALPKFNFKRQGEPVNAVYGFFSMLLKAIAILEPDYLIACFDASGPTFRHKKFVGYQANRPKMEDELSSQIRITRKAVEEIGIPVLIKPGFEADDLIGTIAKKLKIKNKLKIVIVTGDKDLMQLVTKKTKLFLLGKGVSEAELVGPKQVAEKLGIKPEQVIDYKALVGDPSDNYPGVLGIGPKTASKLLDQFDGLNEILAHLEILDPKLKEKLEAGRESASLSYQLAKIAQNVPIKLKLSESRLDEKKISFLKKVLEKLNFPSLVRRLEKQSSQNKIKKQMDLFK